MSSSSVIANRFGRLQKAPEFFLTRDAMTLPRDDRRSFLRKAFLAAGAATLVAAPSMTTGVMVS